jgi:tRNA U34 2-thiouridine synthase MnmA/TrmU
MIVLDKKIEGVGGEKSSAATDLALQNHYSRAKVSKYNWVQLRYYEKISKILFPFVELIKPVVRPLKKLFLK